MHCDDLPQELTKRGDSPRVLSVRNRWIRTRRFSPKASCLVLGLGELCAFAVNLGRLSIARFEQNSGTVPEFFLFTIGGSAPGAFRLVLGIGELCAFAVNLGRLSIARFEQNAGTVPEFFHRAVGEGNAVGLPSSTADSVAESNVLREPAPTLHLLLESRRDPPVVALRLPPANGFDPSGIRCPGLPIGLLAIFPAARWPARFKMLCQRSLTPPTSQQKW
jgi:hypothetical protein